ncbi:MAG: amidase [Deltaproteobacteria bacterium]|nr:amidase [Deltaproteobacteria bacterium]
MFALADALLASAKIRGLVGWAAARLGGDARWPAPDVRAGDALPDGSPADTDDPWTWRATVGSRAPVSPGPDAPLAGWTFALKDNFDVAGVPWNEGTAVDRPAPERDAAILQRLEAAGATLAGKAQMTELGLSGLGLQPHRGTLDNPAAPGHFTGGSSSGPAVLVARGEVRFAIGSDALGSVRIPAAFTGLFGLKPTRGALHVAGYRTLAPELDMPGPLARTLDDLRAVYAVIADRSPRDRDPAPTGRVLVSKVALPAAPELSAAVMRAARDLELAPGPRPDFQRALTTAIMTGGSSLREVPCPPRAGPEVRLVLGLARCFDDRVARRAADDRRALTDAFTSSLDKARADALLVPTTAIAAPARTRARLRSRPEPGLHAALGIFTALANVTGCPAIAVPVGRDARGRPLSAMLVGRHGAEATLFALAARLAVRADPAPSSR